MRSRCVNCRVGSLEKRGIVALLLEEVNCRVGSLESSHQLHSVDEPVNCRVGSLEKYVPAV